MPSTPVWQGVTSTCNPQCMMPLSGMTAYAGCFNRPLYMYIHMWQHCKITQSLPTLLSGGAGQSLHKRLQQDKSCQRVNLRHHSNEFMQPVTTLNLPLQLQLRASD